MLQNTIREAGVFPPLWVYSSYFVKWEISCKLFFSCFREEKSQQHDPAVYFDIHFSKNSYLQQFVTSNMHFLLWTYPKILKGSLIKLAESLTKHECRYIQEVQRTQNWTSASETLVKLTQWKTFVSAQRYFITEYFTVLLICNKK